MIDNARIKRRYTKMHCNILSELDCAYIAGLVDADGCIRISKQLAHGKTLRYTMVVSVANTDTKIIDYLIKIVGGGVNELQRAKAKLVCFQWKITAVAALEFLDQLIPYLISKKEEAEVAVLFQERRGTVGKHKTLFEKDVDEILYLRCKDLKGERGISLPEGGVLS